MFRRPDVARLKSSGDVVGLIKALAHRKDETVRVEAARALGETGDQRAIDPLVAWLREAPHNDGRVAAIDGIATIGGPAATDALVDLLTHPSRPVPLPAAVESKVARALGDIGDQRAIDPLKDWLHRAPQRKDLVAAIDGIATIGGPAATDVLLELLADPPRYVGPQVARALGETGDQRAIGPLAVWLRRAERHDDRVVAIDGIATIGGPAATDALLELIARPPEPARVDGGVAPVLPEVARRLAEAGDTRAIRPLEAVIRTGMPRPAHAAIEAIGKIGGQDAADFLLDLFNEVTADERADHARACVARALRDAGDQRALEPLKAWLHRTDKAADREAAMAGIGRIGGPAVADFLLDLLPDARYRDGAAAALGYTGDPRVLTRLLQLRADASVKPAAIATGLGRLGDPRAVSALCEIIQQARAQQTGWNPTPHRNFMSAVAALERIGDPSALPALEMVRTDPPSEEQLSRARDSDFDAGYEAALFWKARSEAVNRAIASLEARRSPGRGGPHP